jgi:hypothetical protein
VAIHGSNRPDSSMNRVGLASLWVSVGMGII